MKIKGLYVVIVICLTAIQLKAQSNNRVELIGKRFVINGKDFNPVIMNYNAFITFLNGNYFVNPHPGYGISDAYESLTEGDATKQMHDHFFKIKEMGFNCIRLILATPTKKNYHIVNRSVVCDPISEIPLYTNSFDLRYANGNTNMGEVIAPIDNARQFDMIQKVLDIAESVGIKVLLLSGGKGCFCTPLDQQNYADYLAALSAHFANNTTLMGYDLYNEPIYESGGPIDPNQPNQNLKFPKGQVCTMMNMFYDVIKTNAPYQLVTIGLNDPLETEAFDPNILKVDFISFHIYPHRTGSQLAYVTKPSTAYKDAFSKVESDLAWISRNVQLPWIIGETGFTSSINNTVSGCDGRESDEAHFVQDMIASVIKYGASGFSWWWYQEATTSTIAKDNHYGPIHQHTEVNITSGIDVNDKPSVAVFRAGMTFSPYQVDKTLPLPDVYYNYTKTTGSIITTGKITASDIILDPSGASSVPPLVQPVVDAILIAYSPDYTSSKITYSKPDGSYSFSTDFTIGELKVFAVGTNVVHNYQTGSVRDVKLNRYVYSDNIDYTNLNSTSPINIGTSQGYAAKNNITLRNILVDGNGSTGGNLSVTANNSIILYPGVVIKNGANALLKILPPETRICIDRN